MTIRFFQEENCPDTITLTEYSGAVPAIGERIKVYSYDKSCYISGRVESVLRIINQQGEDESNYDVKVNCESLDSVITSVKSAVNSADAVLMSLKEVGDAKSVKRGWDKASQGGDHTCAVQVPALPIYVRKWYVKRTCSNQLILTGKLLYGRAVVGENIAREINTESIGEVIELGEWLRCYDEEDRGKYGKSVVWILTQPPGTLGKEIAQLFKAFASEFQIVRRVVWGGF